jgi:hypothetical protein
MVRPLSSKTHASPFFPPRPYGLQVYLQRDDEAVDLHVLSLIFRRPLPPAPARRLLHLFLLAASDSSASAFDGGPIRPGGGGGWWPARRGESGHWRGGWPRVRADWPWARVVWFAGASPPTATGHSQRAKTLSHAPRAQLSHRLIRHQRRQHKKMAAPFSKRYSQRRTYGLHDVYGSHSRRVSFLLCKFRWEKKLHARSLKWAKTHSHSCVTFYSGVKRNDDKLVTSWASRTDSSTRYYYFLPLMKKNKNKNWFGPKRPYFTLPFLHAASLLLELLLLTKLGRLLSCRFSPASDCSDSFTRAGTLFVLLFVRKQTVSLYSEAC